MNLVMWMVGAAGRRLGLATSNKSKPYFPPNPYYAVIQLLALVFECRCAPPSPCPAPAQRGCRTCIQPLLEARGPGPGPARSRGLQAPLCLRTRWAASTRLSCIVINGHTLISSMSTL